MTIQHGDNCVSNTKDSK